MIPENFYCYKQSPIWTQINIPQELQEKHNSQAWIYSEINIISGSLEYTEFNEDSSISSINILTPSNHGIVSPELFYSVKAVSGDSFVCQSARAAVLKANTFSVSKDPQVYAQMKDINLTVQPEFN